jgi:hypothetical protein
MNLFIYLKLKEINYPFRRKPVIILKRPWTHEFEWYCERMYPR